VDVGTMMATSGQTAAVPSLWAPLRVPAFRVLWLAQLGTMLGTWMQTAGAQWLMVTQPDSAALVALVPVAAVVPCCFSHSPQAHWPTSWTVIVC
jgi:hypothetical protein